MADSLDTFITWYNNVFKIDPLYVAMEQCVEDSPWHRERNVAVHTDMVVDQYLSRCNISFSTFSIIGAIACAFHDVGKPAAMTLKFREDRGYYNAFNGHEQMSARLWEQYAVENWPALVKIFDLVPMDIYRIGVMIEHHVPWGLRDKRKLDAVILTMLSNTYRDTFGDVLLSDTYGRISDDGEEKQKKSQIWVDTEIAKRQSWDWWEEIDNKENVLYVPISASGGGKSTLFRDNRFSDVENFSLDKLRHRWYHETDYAYAFEQSCKDKGFIHKAQKEFTSLLREKKDVYLDNTNTTRKTRRFWITEARNRNYKVVAFLFPSDSQTMVDRQFSREDKSVPAIAVLRQYDQMQMPLYYSEADEIIVLDINLPK